MTDNIQKLYEVAGVTCKNLEFCEDCIYLKNNQCVNKQEFINECLPFTAEKQLELIKWISQDISQNCILHIDRWTSGKVRFAFDKEKYNHPNYDSDYADGHDHFDQALAGLILQLWDELSSKQREEVRGIL